MRPLIKISFPPRRSTRGFEARLGTRSEPAMGSRRGGLEPPFNPLPALSWPRVPRPRSRSDRKAASADSEPLRPRHGHRRPGCRPTSRRPRGRSSDPREGRGGVQEVRPRSREWWRWRQQSRNKWVGPRAAGPCPYRSGRVQRTDGQGRPLVGRPRHRCKGPPTSPSQARAGRRPRRQLGIVSSATAPRGPGGSGGLGPRRGSRRPERQHLVCPEKGSVKSSL